MSASRSAETRYKELAIDSHGLTFDFRIKNLTRIKITIRIRTKIFSARVEHDKGGVMRICMLGSGLIGNFYAMALQGHRGADRITVVYSRTLKSAQNFAGTWSVPHATDDLVAAVNHPDVDAVVIGLPNHLHEPAVLAAVEAGKPVLCTKPLGRERGGSIAYATGR